MNLHVGADVHNVGDRCLLLSAPTGQDLACETRGGLSAIPEEPRMAMASPDRDAVTVNGTRPAAYLETRSALNRPLLIRSLSWPAAQIAFLILGVTFSQPWFFVIMSGLLVPAMVWLSLLYRNWPTGIRLDEAAVSIGAVNSAQAARRTPSAYHQSRGLLACPWPAVTGARVVTDRTELRRMNDSPRYHTFTNQWGGRRINGGRPISHCNIGVLASPGMRAALVIDIDPAAVITPRIRPGRLYSNGLDGRGSRLVQPQLSPTWVVPTRHPEALSRALEAMMSPVATAGQARKGSSLRPAKGPQPGPGPRSSR